MAGRRSSLGRLWCRVLSKTTYKKSKTLSPHRPTSLRLQNEEMSNDEEIHVGAPPGPPSAWVTKKVHFHGFPSLTTTKGDAVVSPEFECFGHQWSILLYPGGNHDSDEEFVCIAFQNKSKKNIHIKLNLIVRDYSASTNGSDITKMASKFIEFAPHGAPYDAANSVTSARVDNNFARRDTLINDYLVNETLTVEVQMRTTKIISSGPFVPKASLNASILNIFDKEDTADVVFELGGEQSAIFYAHRFILELNSQTLADMCSGDPTPVTINNVAPEVFRNVLYFCYGGEISKEDMAAYAREIIDAADRFEIVPLKLAAEVFYVETTELSVKNIMEVLIHADTKNLALLKETTMDFIAENEVDVVEAVSFDDFPRHLVKDLLIAKKRSKTSQKSDCGDEYSLMRISELRRMAHEKGLDVDGSREALISALRGSYTQR